MRVIAGSHRGATLRAPRGDATRPTSDRVREALFSMLGPVVELRVLDLFAGSGALGIEALSRGAASTTFVDDAAAAVDAVRRNLQSLRLEGEVLRRPALATLASPLFASRQYDLVFLDPPYRLATELGPQLSAALPGVLAPDARVVAESDRRAVLELEMPLLKERTYGDTLIRIHAPR
jgi:16S rRNA (guanine(966)-N(2))-methyltransferase RsmD